MFTGFSHSFEFFDFRSNFTRFSRCLIAASAAIASARRPLSRLLKVIDALGKLVKLHRSSVRAL
jgi:hypothetical protein